MTDSNKVRRRVITCQGSLQLITALSVALCHSDVCMQEVPDCPDITYQDYLVIYDVSPDFAAVIQNIAASVWTWQQITYLNPQQVRAFAAQALAGYKPHMVFAMRPAMMALREQIGTQTADEVYLVRNWQTGNQLVINAYYDATKIAYGDGIGYYFGPKRFQPKPQGFSLVQSRISALLARFRRNDQSLPTIPFDVAYFLLPDIFKESPPMSFRVPDRRFIDLILRRIAESLSSEYRLSIKTDQPIAILLPGNFAQAGWTTRKKEFNAYVETLLEKVDSQAFIVIKPHPRNTPRDIRFFRQVLQKHFVNFQILQAPISHIPMEALLFEQFNAGQAVTILGFTTACIPLAFLYGIKCSVGFGRSRLARYFPGTNEHMWENEVLLQEIVEQLHRPSA